MKKLIPDTRPAKRSGTEPLAHHVKSKMGFFLLAWTGLKNSEIRLNDRDYRAGDLLYQWEYDPVAEGDPRSFNHSPPPLFTGRCMSARIALVLEQCPGLLPGYCLLILESITHHEKDISL